MGRNNVDRPLGYLWQDFTYRMDSNFHGVQIFVDFVGSFHPRKFYFALIFYLLLIDPLYHKNKEAAAEINFGTWPIISPSSLITATENGSNLLPVSLTQSFQHG